MMPDEKYRIKEEEMIPNKEYEEFKKTGVLVETPDSTSDFNFDNSRSVSQPQEMGFEDEEPAFDRVSDLSNDLMEDIR